MSLKNLKPCEFRHINTLNLITALSIFSTPTKVSFAHFQKRLKINSKLKLKHTISIWLASRRIVCVPLEFHFLSTVLTPMMMMMISKRSSLKWNEIQTQSSETTKREQRIHRDSNNFHIFMRNFLFRLKDPLHTHLLLSLSYNFFCALFSRLRRELRQIDFIWHQFRIIFHYLPLFSPFDALQHDRSPNSIAQQNKQHIESIEHQQMNYVNGKNCNSLLNGIPAFVMCH